MRQVLFFCVCPTKAIAEKVERRIWSAKEDNSKREQEIERKLTARAPICPAEPKYPACPVQIPPGVKLVMLHPDIAKAFKEWQTNHLRLKDYYFARKQEYQQKYRQLVQEITEASPFLSEFHERVAKAGYFDQVDIEEVDLIKE